MVGDGEGLAVDVGESGGVVACAVDAGARVGLANEGMSNAEAFTVGVIGIRVSPGV